jgi:hypothetical protein
MKLTWYASRPVSAQLPAPGTLSAAHVVYLAHVERFKNSDSGKRPQVGKGLMSSPGKISQVEPALPRTTSDVASAPLQPHRWNSRQEVKVVLSFDGSQQFWRPLKDAVNAYAAAAEAGDPARQKEKLGTIGHCIEAWRANQATGLKGFELFKTSSDKQKEVALENLVRVIDAECSELDVPAPASASGGAADEPPASALASGEPADEPLAFRSERTADEPAVSAPALHPDLPKFSCRVSHRRYRGKNALIAAILRDHYLQGDASDYITSLISLTFEKMSSIPPPFATPEVIIGEKEHAYCQAVIKAFGEAVDETDGPKGAGTQLGNTKADYNGLVDFSTNVILSNKKG